MGEHTGCRGLSVRSGNADRMRIAADKHSEKLGARKDLCTAFLSANKLRVGFGYSSCENDRIKALLILRRISIKDRDIVLFQKTRIIAWLEIVTGNADTAFFQDQCERRHADAADTDKIYARSDRQIHENPTFHFEKTAVRSMQKLMPHKSKTFADTICTGIKGKDCTDMEITDVKIRKTFDNQPLKAVLSVTFDASLAVHDVKIIYARERYFVVMPSKKTQNGEYKDTVHPINAAFRKVLEDTLIEAYLEEIHTQEPINV